MDIVTVASLTKTYGRGETEVSALRNVNLTIKRGEMLAIMGPSGSGKSTLLHLIGGLDRPTSGTVAIDGVEIAALDDKRLSQLRRRKLGFVFQMYNLLPVLTVRENVAMPLILDGVKRREALQRADDTLAQVGLSEKADRRANELSGGQQQRVSIARALVVQPALILADEPTGALDSETGQEVIRLLRRLVTDLKQTVVTVTHDPRVAAHANRIVTLKDGRIIDDTPLGSANGTPQAQPELALSGAK